MKTTKIMNYYKSGALSGLICTYLFLFACTQNAAATKLNSNNMAAPIQYERRNLQKDTNDYTFLGLENCQGGIIITEKKTIIPCHKKAFDTKTDYGLRLFLINTSKQNPTIDDYSRGFKDAYYIKLSGFFNKYSDQPKLIMAEYGAEYSYGVNAFKPQDDNINFLGMIDEVVNIDENAASVVPYISITEFAGKIRFTFLRDILKINKQGEYIPVNKEKIKYIYSKRDGFHREENTRNR
jgi:hypothetical protein